MQLRPMNMRHRAIGFLLLVAIACPAQANWFQAAENKMGTRVFVKLWHEDEGEARELLTAAMAEVDRIEASMSTYRTDSDVSRVNARASEDWVPVGEELFGLIRRSLGLSAQTNGTFDITYDSVGQFYDFNQHQRPSDRQVQASLPAIDYRHIQLDEDSFSVRFSHADVRINLGGIAKGYAVASVIRLLKDAGVLNALVNAGGDTQVIGDRVDGPWIVGIRDPDNELSFTTRLALSDEAISTSGDYEQFFIEDGTRYHHILNPSTGSPADSVRSATVTGPDATMTDGLSTSVFVMGTDAGLELLESLSGYDGIIIDGERRVHYSTGVDPL